MNSEAIWRTSLPVIVPFSCAESPESTTWQVVGHIGWQPCHISGCHNGFGMAKRDFGAVAVDLGASSGRFAAGWLEEGTIRFQIIEQKAHQAAMSNGRLEWDLQSLKDLAASATDYAASVFESSTLGIDAWGVDHGFVDFDSKLIGNPVCYRDLSHERAFEELAPHRPELYSLTGIQHQPFNTICQLYARYKEDGVLPSRARFLVLPDLLGYLLTGEINYELTEASTTQLMGLDCRWSERAFQIARWPMPDRQPSKPGNLGGAILPGVRLAHVGSHDTASALVGFGLQSDQFMYVNVGTWSLAMFVREEPIATPAAEAANFTNERMADGRVRFLKNIPGFYVLNRLHEELKVGVSVPEWINSAENTGESLDLFAPAFFNPTSMMEACSEQLGREPTSGHEWAGIAINSLAQAIAAQPAEAERLGVRPVSAIRIGGGGSQSAALCQAIANCSGLSVLAGPVEATVVGNLALQFLAAGYFDSADEMAQAVERSAGVVEYRPA
jgi:rhamnulokinase